ncbi:flagellar hook-length control protein FliK [Paraburkholderia bonniea]|uniref:flagellar hook-length control protein FliK n=1 Tax=Paraburkholderia bonniea TaxID=2152891 RepID=UPI0025745E4B|nr:flagellar hook-length control protein FliK [Paraburkholderia bonniea]WJF90465.1 flagellar hook-length control protein FliK [Paraburkholderia bonniea]WJF93780.1 flagellar hook-length control protein FliK [Paraburkholderia bonniea]
MSPLSFMQALTDSPKTTSASAKATDAGALSFAQTLQANLDAQSGGVHAITNNDRSAADAARADGSKASSKNNGKAKDSSAAAKAETESASGQSDAKPAKPATPGAETAATTAAAAAQAQAEAQAAAKAKAAAEADADASAQVLSADDLARALAEAAAAAAADGSTLAGTTTATTAATASTSATNPSATTSAEAMQAALAALAASQNALIAPSPAPDAASTGATDALIQGNGLASSANLAADNGAANPALTSGNDVLDGPSNGTLNNTSASPRSAVDALHNNHGSATANAAAAAAAAVTVSATPAPATLAATQHSAASLLQETSPAEAHADNVLLAPPLGAGSATAAYQNANTASSPALAPPVGTPDWDEALSQKVVFLSNAHQQSAELTLNPRELGQLQVTLQVSGNHAHALFVSQHPQVREAIEAALPRLREAMEAGGLGLGSASVSDGFARDSGQQAREGWSSGQQAHGGHGGGFDDGVTGGITTVATPRKRGLVDTFV